MVRHPEAREEYIRESADKLLFAATDGENTVGFLYLERDGARHGGAVRDGRFEGVAQIGRGRALVEAAKRAAHEAGYAFMQVKTVQMGKYAEYDATNRFYLAMGVQGVRGVSAPVGRMEPVSGIRDGTITNTT